jgi:hypothetical protein
VPSSRFLPDLVNVPAQRAHIIQSDTSMDNVEVFIAAVKKHGVYH